MLTYADVVQHISAIRLLKAAAAELAQCAIHQFAPVSHIHSDTVFFFLQQISVIRLLKAEGAELAQYTSSRLSEQEAQHLEHVARLESEWRAIHTRLEDARRDEVCKSVY
jgi:hypothetical protein